MPRLREYNYARWAQASARLIRKDEPAVLAVDTETPGVKFHDEAYCVTMSWRSGDRIRNSYFELGDIDFAEGLVREILSAANEEWGTVLVFHNAKFDLQKLRLGVAGQPMIDADWFGPARVHDTEGIYHLLYPNDDKGLKKLAVQHLKRGMVQVPIATGKNKGNMRWVMREEHEMNSVRKRMGLKKDQGYEILPREFTVPYAMKDTEYTLELFEKAYPVLEPLEGLIDCYRMEQELCFALLDMEASGIGVDTEYLAATASEYGVRIIEAEGAIRDLAGNPDLNPNAPVQLTEAFKARGITLEDTTADTLAKLSDPLAQAILDYRGMTKIYKTYLRGLLDETVDGVVHPNIRQHGARTGRTSSGTVRPDG